MLQCNYSRERNSSLLEMKLADWCLLSNVYKIKYLDSEYKAF